MGTTAETGARANAPQWSTCAGQDTKSAPSTGAAAATNWTSWPARRESCISWRSRPAGPGSLTPPEAAVTPQKFRALTRAAVRYLAATGGQEEAQFDLAAVDVMPDGRMEVRLVERAMEYNW